MRNFAIVTACLLIAGCATKMEERTAEAPLGDSNMMGVMREFAAPTSFIGPVPTAVVILDQDQKARNEAFCGGFLKVDSAADAADAASGYVDPTIATRWLVVDDKLTDAQKGTCTDLVARYDFDRAVDLKAALIEGGLDKKSFDGDGPFIVEFLPTGGALVVSASAIAQASLRTFATSWTSVAGKATAIGTQADPPADCTITDADSKKCSLQRIAMDTTASYLKIKFPEAGIFVALGERLTCAVMKKNERTKWCAT